MITENKQTIGFVPTMGSLHEGHLALVEEANKEADVVVLSIFVNPLQFGENEDFDDYPRHEENDLALTKAHKVDYVFIPTVKEMYPKSRGITMAVTQRIGVLCDRSRPGHFQGVLTVLTKLFHIVQPTYTYFGMKDAQQIAIVDLLIEELDFPIQLRMVPTVREGSGLAKSSRNVHLTSSERVEASILFETLKLGEKRALDGEYSADKIVSELKEFLQAHVSGKIDYIELLTFPNLTELKQLEGQVIIALAVQYEQARLIDNIIFEINR